MHSGCSSPFKKLRVTDTNSWNDNLVASLKVKIIWYVDFNFEQNIVYLYHKSS